MKKNKELIIASIGWIILIVSLIMTSCCKKVTENSYYQKDSTYVFKEIKDTTITFKPIKNHTIIPKSYGDTSYTDIKDDSIATVITTVSKKDGTVVVDNNVIPKPIIITKYKDRVIEGKTKVIEQRITKTITQQVRPWYFIPTIVIAFLIGIFTQKLFNVAGILYKVWSWILK